MFPETWTLEQIIVHAFKEIITNQQLTLANQEKQMSALTDLQTAVAKLNTDVQAFIAANSGGATDAQLEAVTTAVNAVDALVNPPAPAPAS